MAGEKDLTHLLKLLDDDSASIRDKVWKALSENLPAWHEPLRLRMQQLPAASRQRIEELLAEKFREGFRAEWIRWRDLTDENEKLEAALAGLSAYLSGTLWKGSSDSPLGAKLDALVREFRAGDGPVTASRLALFLFSEKGLRGADADYYEPRNSDLAHVIEKGQGIPISLACIFILTGKRLGLEVEGCDVPEHFLTRARENGEDLVIDCYDGGKVLGSDRLAQLERKYAPDFNRLLRARASAEAIVARVLRNLINAYHLAGNREASEFMWSLAEDLRGEGRSDE
jgi:hypothetical protein